MSNPNDPEWNFKTSYCPICGRQNIRHNPHSDDFTCLDCEWSFDVVLYEDEVER